MIVGLSVGVGEAVIERGLDIGRWWAKAEPADRELFKREQTAELERMPCGPDRAKAVVTQAAKVLADGIMAQNGDETFMRSLFNNGALDDAGLIMHLANQGARRSARA
jgi:hypothetical protein